MEPLLDLSGNSNQFDVDSYVPGGKKLFGRFDNNRASIAVGDRVLIWRSGANSGVMGMLYSAPNSEIQEDAPDLWRAKPESQIDENALQARVLDAFIDKPIGSRPNPISPAGAFDHPGRLKRTNFH